ncbi:hypothetical protein RB195_007602 [Necator americanus]|uniref:MATH domain-containing protein n=1 Tax=Necator americanus TaxID=51031 RepID=A0ABR1C1H9_NECAM
MLKNNNAEKNVPPRPSSVAITLTSAESSDNITLPRMTTNIARMRSPTHSPLTPVGTPEKPFADIMILPKDVNENNEISAEDQSCIGMTGSELLKNLPKGVSACPFLEHGCHKVGTEMEVKLHVRDDRIFHLVLLCRAVIQLKKAYIESIREKPLEIAELERRLIPAHWIVKKFGPQCLFHIPMIHNVIRDVRKSGRNLIFSQPFETHRFGYKMTVMVAPYGDAEVAREYISVYVAIVRSDYDPIQRWPFSFPITFTMMAADPAKNLERTFIPNPTKENNAFLGRPEGARNAAFGIQRFCKLIDLNNYTICNDLFLGVYVDLSTLYTEPTPRMPSDLL